MNLHGHTIDSLHLLNNLEESLTIIDVNGVVLFLNKQAEKVQYLTIGPLRPGDSFFDSMTLEKKDLSKEIISQLIAGKSNYVLNTSYHDADGANVHVQVKFSTIVDEQGHVTEIIIETRDVTPQKVFERKSESVAIELSNLIENANAVIIGTDSQGYITEWNELSAKITGYPKSEALTNRFADLLLDTENQLNFSLTHREVLTGGLVSNYELPILARGGQRLTCLINATPRKNIAGQVIGVLLVGQDITELTEYRRSLEGKVDERTRELSEEKNFSESIINSLPGLFYVIHENQFIRWNKNFETTLGYSSAEIKLLPVLDIIAEDERELGKHALQNIYHVNSPSVEINIITKGKTKIPYYLTGHPAQIRNASLILGTGINILDLKTTQKALRIHEERLELAFSSSGHAWWDLDFTTGRIETHPNRYLPLGYVHNEVNASFEWWLTLLHPNDREKVNKSMADHSSGKTATYDVKFRLRAKNGDYKWFHDLGKIVERTAEGQPVRMVGTVNDITESKIIEDELKEAKHIAETANRTKGQFLANMSHEIRTPLNAVIGLSHLALKTDLSAKQQDYLKKIQSSSESLLGIINDILDFSKIESGKLKLEEVAFDLEEVFQRLADVITYKAQAKGLEIAFGINDQVPTHLIGDPVRLEQVLSNLCSNAVKFTDHGEVVIEVSILHNSDDNLKLQFKVEDTGIGMDRAQLGRLFEPFTQADDSISRKYGGTGLGLSIIKRLVDLMNGKIWVESEPGKGSSFYFTAWLKKQKQQYKIPVPSIDVRRLRLLVVDDNRSSKQIIRNALESLSFQVIAVDSGIQAIHFLKNNFHYQPVDIVLMDWKMPDMDGLEAAAIIRHDRQLAGVKIIMMCNSYASEHLYQKTEELGLAGVLKKPIRYSILYDTIIGVIQTPAANPPEKIHYASAPIAVQGSRGLVLLVEDNEINQQVARELLESFGFNVDIASNGLEALNRVKAAPPDHYNLVLMDLQMPVMGGFRATVEIRKLKGLETLPIIAMTADAMMGVREKCIESGMMDFISKPINPNQMLDTIEKWIDNPGKKSARSKTGVNKQTIKRISIEGIDQEAGLHHLAGNQQLYHNLLIKFTTNQDYSASELTRKFLLPDWEEGKRLIHTLKGLSGNLGMTKLQEACVKAEEHINSTSSFQSIDFLVPLTSELTRLRKALSVSLTPETADELKTLKEARPILNELKKLLANDDPEAVNLLQKIGNVQGYETQISQIKEALSNYDFDGAIEILVTMKSPKKEHTKN